MTSLTDWTDRWTAFTAKVDSRIDAIVVEAGDAYTDVANVNPLDPAPIAAIDMALQGRINDLTDRIATAFEQIDAGIDELMDEEGRPRTHAELTAARDAMETERDALSVRAQRAEHQCRVRSLAAVGETLQQLAQAEDPTQTCVQCGSPFDPGVVVQSTAMPCPGCGARVTVGPKAATLQWFSRGAGAIAEAEALPQWVAFQDAEAAFNALRHPTPADFEVLAAAYRAQVAAEFEALVSLHPAWDADRAATQVEGRCKQLESVHCRFTARAMSRIGSGLETARRRDVSALSKWASEQTSTPQGRSSLLDDLMEAAAERRDRGAAETLVLVAHSSEAPRWFGRRRWMQSKLAELSSSFA